MQPSLPSSILVSKIIAKNVNENIDPCKIIVQIIKLSALNRTGEKFAEKHRHPHKFHFPFIQDQNM